tara:strand:+ start:1585 stop:2295 length:711 start_codon:yes stop_codon:yes gene_type:complete
MKTKLIAEIGLNHLGNERYLKTIQSFLSKKNIDGLTIQVPGESLMQQNQKKFLLNDKKIINFIKVAKKQFKFVGIATDTSEKVDFFSKLNIDFFKVTSGMFTNINLIKKMQESPVKKIFLSTGFSNYQEIKKTLKKIKNKKNLLIHTTFKKDIKDLNLKNINFLKKKFNIPVAYGNHSIFLESIPNAIFYEPDFIFFYVKLNNNLNYPDNKHAIKLNQLDSILKKIENNIKMSGIK